MFRHLFADKRIKSRESRVESRENKILFFGWLSTLDSRLSTKFMREKYNTQNFPRQANVAEVRKKQPPPVETNAEIYYYKKQIDAHTLMTIVLLDGEEIEGTIEWYDIEALKINRQDAPNLLILKHNIKYMFKAEEKVESKKAKTKSLSKQK